MPYRTSAQLAGRHPFEIYILYLSVLAGLPTVLGVTPQPGSVAGALPGWVATVWAWVMVVGSITALVGIYWRNRGTGLIVEQLGIGFVGVASLVYVACILAQVGGSGILPSGILGGFGIACLARYRDIQRDLDAAHLEVATRRRTRRDQ